MTAPFVLGTVQLGLPYGIANHTGMPSQDEAFAILDKSYDVGVRTLDTANAYGAAETVIGQWLRSRNRPMEIVTKVPALNGQGAAFADATLRQSLERLGVPRVRALLLHRALDWLAPGIADWLLSVKSRGLVETIGVSIYDGRDLPDDPRIGLIQLPCNISNPATLSRSQSDTLMARECRIHVRSVFAQGALLTRLDDLPTHLHSASSMLGQFSRLADSAGVSRAALAIAAVKRLYPTGEVVLGAETVMQVAELAVAASTQCPPYAVDAALELGRTLPPTVMDPRSWQPAKAAAS